jgi:hypothetical protein
MPGSGSFGFVFCGPSGTVLSAWTRPGSTRTITTPSPVTVVDPHSGSTRTASSITLTSSPVLLVAAAGSAASDAWLKAVGGALSTVKSWDGEELADGVSLAAGARPKGLHWACSSTARTVNGVAEFDLAGTTGCGLAVDPAFAGYGAGPLTVTVVIRGHGTGIAITRA